MDVVGPMGAALPLGFAAVLGLVVGSFLNVVIHRLPQGGSLLWPGSHCPRCQAPVRWYDNLPVLSWLLLRGRCRSCRVAISARYPAVELLTGAPTEEQLDERVSALTPKS